MIIETAIKLKAHQDCASKNPMYVLHVWISVLKNQAQKTIKIIETKIEILGKLRIIKLNENYQRKLTKLKDAENKKLKEKIWLS